MTQLLLFDAPTHSSFRMPSESPECPTDPRQPEVKEPRQVRRARQQTGVRSVCEPNQKDSAEELIPPRGGVHRMGDLASLVIARYELAAKRRAALLARGPLPSVRF